MNLLCLIKGHVPDSKKLREVYIEDKYDALICSNSASSPFQYGYDVRECKRCKKEISTLNGKKII